MHGVSVVSIVAGACAVLGFVLSASGAGRAVYDRRPAGVVVLGVVGMTAALLALWPRFGKWDIVFGIVGMAIGCVAYRLSGRGMAVPHKTDAKLIPMSEMAAMFGEDVVPRLTDDGFSRLHLKVKYDGLTFEEQEAYFDYIRQNRTALR